MGGKQCETFVFEWKMVVIACGVDALGSVRYFTLEDRLSSTARLLCLV